VFAVRGAAGFAFRGVDNRPGCALHKRQPGLLAVENEAVCGVYLDHGSGSDGVDGGFEGGPRFKGPCLALAIPASASGLELVFDAEGVAGQAGATVAASMYALTSFAAEFGGAGGDGLFAVDVGDEHFGAPFSERLEPPGLGAAVYDSNYMRIARNVKNFLRQIYDGGSKPSNIK
jgi:hypothetical protein